MNETNPQETSDLVTSTEEILNGKFHFLRSIITPEKRALRENVTTVI